MKAFKALKHRLKMAKPQKQASFNAGKKPLKIRPVAISSQTVSELGLLWDKKSARLPFWARLSFNSLKFTAALIVGALLSVPMLNAFEARMIGVTARIMPPPCDESLKEAEGCQQNNQENNQEAELDILPKVLGAETQDSGTSTSTSTLETLPEQTDDSTTTSETDTSTPPSEVDNGEEGNGDASSTDESIPPADEQTQGSQNNNPPPQPDPPPIQDAAPTTDAPANN